jgi:hypothetical protein
MNKLNTITKNNCRKTKIVKMNNLILGKTYIEALRLYNNIRVIKLDGINIVIKMDYCEERCNVEIEKGVIIKIYDFY